MVLVSGGTLVCVLGLLAYPWATGSGVVDAGRLPRGQVRGSTLPGSSRGHSGHGDTLAPCQTKSNQSQLNSFLWVLKRDPPSFFFGTIHVPHSRVWSYIPENTKDAFYRADRVYFELDLTDPYTISSLANCQLLPRGERVADVLPRPLYERLKQHLDHVRLMMPSWVTSDQRSRGLYPDYLFNAITGNWERKRPVWLMLMVNSLTKTDIRSRGTPVLDLYLAQEAQRLDKRTGAVEQVAEQCLPLNALNFSQVLFALDQTLSRHEQGGPRQSASSYSSEELITHYNCGDLDSVLFSQDTAQVPSLLNASLAPPDRLTARQIDDYFRNELIYKRNHRMADRIDSLLSNNPDKSMFFAFGAGHFLGNNTVLDALRERGYEVQHAAPGETLDLGERHRRRRKKYPPLMADLAPEDRPSGGSLDSLDPYYDTRTRTRHRHGCGSTPGRRRHRTRCPEPTTPASSLKYPQFNDLWVRLDGSSLGPDMVFGSAVRPTRPEEPVYAMYNAAPSLAAYLDRTLGTCLLATVTVFLTRPHNLVMDVH